MSEKTRMCPFHARGTCRRGQACNYAHSEVELLPQLDQQKKKLCIDYFRNGTCPLGSFCKYAHSAQEIPATTPPRRAQNGSSASTTSAMPAPEAWMGASSRPAQPRRHRRTQQAQPQHAEQQPPDDRELQAVEERIRDLQAQLRQLQAAGAGPVMGAGSSESGRNAAARSNADPIATVDHEGPADASCADSECDFSAAADAWSRQSTKEPAAPLHALSRQVTEDVEPWSGFPDGIFEEHEESGMNSEQEELFDCELVVRGTFLSLVPTLNNVAVKRARSASAGRMW